MTEFRNPFSDDVPPPTEQSPLLGQRAQDGDAGRRGSIQLPPFSKLSTFLIMLALSVDIFLIALDAGIVSTSLPAIAAQFGRESGYAWIGTAYILSWAVAAPIWGAVGLVCGAKRTMLTSSLFLIGGSILAGSATSVQSLVTGRAIQGVGGGGIGALANRIVTDITPLSTRGEYLSIIAAVWGLVTPLGPVTGNILAQTGNWRWIFWLNVPAATVTLLILWVLVQLPTDGIAKEETVQHGPKIDWAAIFNIFPAAAVFLVSLDLGGIQNGLETGPILGLIFAGIVWWIVLATIEWSILDRHYNMLPAVLVKDRSNLACLFLGLFHSFGLMAGPFYLAQYFSHVLVLSPIMTAAYLLPFFASVFAGWVMADVWLWQSGRFMDQLWVGMVLMITGFGLHHLLPERFDLARILAAEIVTALGVGFNYETTQVALEAGVAKQDMTTAISGYGFVRQISHFSAMLLGVGVFEAYRHWIISPPHVDPRTVFANGLHATWVLFLVLALQGLFSLFFIKSRNVHHDPSRRGSIVSDISRRGSRLSGLLSGLPSRRGSTF